MSTRIASTFRRLTKSGEAALIVALPVGVPSLELTRRLLPALGRQGADLIELDYAPADAPAVTLDDCLRVASDGRRANEVPLILRLPWDALRDYGVGEFAAHCKTAGVDALLPTGMPGFEVEPTLATLLEQGVGVVASGHDISLPAIRYEAPETGEAAGSLSGEAPRAVEAAPTPRAVALVASQADAVVVRGLAKLIETAPDEDDLLLEASEWVRALKEATLREG